MWNRLRYTVWAPAYDAIARAAGFDSARRLSMDRLRLASGDRVLIVGDVRRQEIEVQTRCGART